MQDTPARQTTTPLSQADATATRHTSHQEGEKLTRQEVLAMVADYQASRDAIRVITAR